MAFNYDDKLVTRDYRFTTATDAEDGDLITQAQHDAALDGVVAAFNAAVLVAVTYDSVPIFLASTDSTYARFPVGRILSAGPQLFTVAPDTATGPTVDTTAGGLLVFEAGAWFSTVARAEVGDTLGATTIIIAGDTYVQDGVNTDLTTGDGVPWRSFDQALHLTYPFGDLASPELPNDAARVSKIFGFDGNSDPEVLAYTAASLSNDARLVTAEAEIDAIEAEIDAIEAEIDVIDAEQIVQNDAIAAIVSLIPTGALARGYSSTLPIGDIVIPATFNNHLDAEIYWDGSTVQYKVSPYDLIDFTLTDTGITDYYVNYTDGNNGNSGTSTGSGNSWKTLDYAVANASTPAIIHVEDDWLGYLSSGSGTKVFSGKIKIIGEGPRGRTFISPMRDDYNTASFGFSASGGNGAYVSTTASAKQYRAQWDFKFLDNKGLARPLIAAVDQAACEAATGAGSFFYDSGSTYLYVHMWDGRLPDPNTGGAPDWAYAESPYDFECHQSLATSAGVMLFENIEFGSHLGTSSIQNGLRYRPVTTGAVNAAVFGMKGCLTHGSGGNGFQIYDAYTTVLEDCHTAHNAVDAFNYHTFVTTGTKGEFISIYEHNCTSRYSGYEGWNDSAALSASSNGSTCHDSSHILRTNTICANANGSVIADVNGVHSLNFNVHAGEPDDGGTASPKALFWHEKYVGVGTTKIMYLWGCGGHDNGDTDVNLIDNTAQAGGSTQDGEVRVKYWRGQKDGAVVGTLKDWDGNDL